MDKNLKDFEGKCIYLTAEAEKPLDSVDPGVLYIIGSGLKSF